MMMFGVKPCSCNVWSVHGINELSKTCWTIIFIYRSIQHRNSISDMRTCCGYGWNHHATVPFNTDLTILNRTDVCDCAGSSPSRCVFSMTAFRTSVDVNQIAWLIMIFFSSSTCLSLVGDWHSALSGSFDHAFDCDLSESNTCSVSCMCLIQIVISWLLFAWGRAPAVSSYCETSHFPGSTSFCRDCGYCFLSGETLPWLTSAGIACQCSIELGDYLIISFILGINFISRPGRLQGESLGSHIK